MLRVPSTLTKDEDLENIETKNELIINFRKRVGISRINNEEKGLGKFDTHMSD